MWSNNLLPGEIAQGLYSLWHFHGYCIPVYSHRDLDASHSPSFKMHDVAFGSMKCPYQALLIALYC